MTVPALVPGGVRRMASKVSWATIDQGLFALSNFTINIAVARGGGAESLGRFAVAFAAYLAVLGLSRALISEPLLALPADRHGKKTNYAATSLTLFWAVASATAVAGIGAMTGRPELIVVAATLPVVLVQDLLRYVAYSQKRPQLAAVLDGIWLVGSLLVWPIVTAGVAVEIAIVCWAGGALAAVLSTWPWFRPLGLGPRAALRWWRTEARSLAAPLLADSVMVVVSAQALVIVVTWMDGDNALGLLRAGQVYFGPLGMVFTALGVLAVPHLAQRGREAGTSVAVKLSMVFTALAVCGVTVVVAAEPIMRSLLYAGSVAVPFALLLPISLQVVVAAAGIGFTVVCKVRRDGTDIAWSRLTSTVLGVVLLIAGTAAFGILGAAWAHVVMGLSYTVEIGIRGVRAARRKSDHSTPDHTGDLT